MKTKAITLLATLCFVSALGKESEPLDLPTDFDTTEWSEVSKLNVSANRKYFKDRAAARSKYRLRLSQIVDKVDRVDFLLLDPTLLKDDEAEKLAEGDRFNLSPYSAFVRITKRESLNAKNLKDVKEAMIQLLQTEEDYAGGAFCHTPDCGITMYSGKENVLFTSFSGECRNYFVMYPDDERASWVGLPEKYMLEPILERITKRLTGK